MHVGGRQTLPVIVVAAGYAVMRLAFVFSGHTPVFHPDTDTYRVTPDLLGRTWRPWVYPLTNALLPDRGVVAFQTFVSALAFTTLAFAIASTLRSRGSKLVIGISILALGAVGRHTLWDSMLMTESLGLALTALLIVTFVWIDRIPPVGVLSVFMLWVFLRDAHVYLGALVVIGVIVWGVPRRRWILPLGCAAIFAWAALAAANNSQAEDYAVRINVAYHVAPDPEFFDWFVDQGMPESGAFALTDLNPDRPGHQLSALPTVETTTEWGELADQLRFRFRFLRADPVFENWLSEHGPRTYTRFLVEHPPFTFGALGRLFVDGDLYDEAFVDRTYMSLSSDEPVGLPGLVPDDGSVFSIILVAAGLAGLGLRSAAQRRLDPRSILPLALLASTVPHVLLAYHGSPWEIGRHGVILTFVLYLSAIWMIMLAFDRGGLDAVALPDVAETDPSA